jgi:invasion protein IalB
MNAQQPRFPLGQVVATPGALAALQAAGLLPFALLYRHQAGDWGDLCEEDKAENELSVAQGFRILSAYTLTTGIKIWLITESDRSVTTVLLPSGAP